MFLREKKKSLKDFSLAISPTFNVLGYQVGGSMKYTENGSLKKSRIFSGLRETDSLRRLAPWLDRPTALAEFTKQEARVNQS